MNTQSVDWNSVFLTANPFAYTTPPKNPKEIVWAGMDQLKEQFERVLVEAQTSKSTQVILNFGAYGSGKTHASIYFSLPDNLPQVMGKHVLSVIVLRVQTPTEASKPDVILYKDVIEAIKFTKVRSVVRQTIEKLGLEQTRTILQDLTESEALGQAIALLGLEPNAKGEPTVEKPIDTSSDWHVLLETFFFSGCSKSDLKKLRLSRNIETAQERFRIIAAILQCLIGLQIDTDVTQCNRVILWIDEMEDLIYFAAKQYRPFTQGLRDLIDRLPNLFTLMMNFTLASPEVFEDTTVVLGEALIERISRQIYFKEPDEVDAASYVREMLGIFRVKPLPQGIAEVYPFSNASLQYLIAALPRRTPRELNKRCSDVITAALRSGLISGEGKGEISTEFIAQMDEEQLDHLE